ncbi:hypothetical protein SBRCBS47491_000893 [Sporothrix bragantina]|uniref:Uncharacterized protein n=1 Tax=Sporothrix bragantina TaxID=671064 RepID=A0ABP0AU23_9PEZI
MQYDRYGPPPAYNDVSAYQTQNQYQQPMPHPSMNQPQQYISPQDNGHLAYNAMPQPYPERHLERHPETYPVVEDRISSDSESRDDDDEAVNELAAHYRRYLSLPTVALGFSSSSPSSLSRPILLPQAFTASFNKPPPPFVRAYPPSLGARDIGISSDLFVAIIDALNLCLVPPAPLQAVSVISQGIGFVPSHIAQGVSAGLGLAVGVGVAAVRIARKKKFLARVNQDVFAPRGLVMEVVKDEEVLRRVGVSLPPVSVESTPQMPTALGGGQHISRASQTRLAQLAPYSAPLSWDVFPPALPTSMLDRIGAKQTASRLAKEEKKAAKKALKTQHKKEKRERKGKSDDDHHSNRKEQKQADKEQKSMSKLEWMVVRRI